ncbi:MAG: asparagine synthase (glutamine-hydrolyzing), partial [Bacteroidota bacterium]
MCGIAGIIDWNLTMTSVDRQSIVEAMNKAILHRGPDGQGTFSHQNASLAMRRLSIIDQAGGKQPIFNEARDICVFFNGEIYNYVELKKSLQEQGHRFSTQSDTEVLVHLYEQYGRSMLAMLKGMFAFCIYDLAKNEFLLARDRFGEKPVYYNWQNGLFSFASEIKSLLRNNRISRQLNHEALAYYFRTSLVPEPNTLLREVNVLPAGHYIFLSKKKLEKVAWYQPCYNKKVRIDDEQEAVDYLAPILKNAVKRQMVSDVPIGAFLSGGIDSSTVVAWMQQQSERPIKTFNVRFEDQAFDESKIAKKVAAHCGTDHHELYIPNLDFDESIFWTIIDHIGLPFRDSSAIPTFLIAKEIAKDVKVALSGDGGDELFGGYALFQWYQKIYRLQRFARPFRSIANAGLAVAQHTPVLNNVSMVRKIKRGVHTSLADLDDIPIALNEMFSEQQIAEIIRRNNPDYALLKQYPRDFKTWSPLRKIMFYRLQYTLPANML